MQLGAITVAEGEKVAALLGAADRDPAVFADADVFVPDRDPNPHTDEDCYRSRHRDAHANAHTYTNGAN